MELIDLPDFGPDEFGQIIDGESDPFGTDHLGISWQSKSDHVGLIDEGRLIASAGWVAVDARVANGPSIEVLGLGGVVVHRDRRGSGVGGHLVLGTMKKMRDRHGSIALLFCRPERQPFYQRLGWFPIADEVTVGQPGGATVMPLRTCWTPLSPGEALPAGALRFEGLPF